MRVLPKKIKFLSVALILALFVSANMLAAEVVSPLYGLIVKNDKTATAEFLKKIKDSSDFPELLREAKKTFGPEIVTMVDKEALDRRTRINHLEEILKLNPRATGVLLELSSLYKKEGALQKSTEYLLLAQELDPSVTN